MERHCSTETKFPTKPKRYIYSRLKFRLVLSEVGLETRIFENGMAIFGRTGATGQRGSPVEVDHFFRKISTWTEVFRPKVPEIFA